MDTGDLLQTSSILTMLLIGRLLTQAKVRNDDANGSNVDRLASTRLPSSQQTEVKVLLVTFVICVWITAYLEQSTWTYNPLNGGAEHSEGTYHSSVMAAIGRWASKGTLKLYSPFGSRTNLHLRDLCNHADGSYCSVPPDSHSVYSCLERTRESHRNWPASDLSNGDPQWLSGAGRRRAI